MVSSEYVCSSCGCVANDKFFNNEHSSGYSGQSGFSDRSRTGMPESLAIHHKGLSTLIGMGDTDARGKALEPASDLVLAADVDFANVLGFQFVEGVDDVLTKDRRGGGFGAALGSRTQVRLPRCGIDARDGAGAV